MSKFGEIIGVAATKMAGDAEAMGALAWESVREAMPTVDRERRYTWLPDEGVIIDEGPAWKGLEALRRRYMQEIANQD